MRGKKGLIGLVLGIIVIILVVFGLGRLGYEFAKEKIFGERGVLPIFPEKQFVPSKGPQLTPEEQTALNSMKALMCAIKTVNTGIFDIATNCPDADNAQGQAGAATAPAPAAPVSTPAGGTAPAPSTVPAAPGSATCIGQSGTCGIPSDDCSAQGGTVISGTSDCAECCRLTAVAPEPASPAVLPTLPGETGQFAPSPEETPTGDATGPLGWLLAVTGFDTAPVCNGAQYGQSCVECTMDPTQTFPRTLEKDIPQALASESINCWNKFQHYKEDPVHCYQINLKGTVSKADYVAELAKVDPKMAKSADWDLPDSLVPGDTFFICATDKGIPNHVVLTKNPGDKCKTKAVGIGEMGCVVKQFELPQAMSANGILDPKTWIPSIGDPEFLAYYESFPEGEDAYWTADRLSMSPFVIAVGAVVNMITPPGTKSSKVIADAVEKQGLKNFAKKETKEFFKDIVFSNIMVSIIKRTVALFSRETPQRAAMKKFIKALVTGKLVGKTPGKFNTDAMADKFLEMLGPQLTRKGALTLDRAGLEKFLREAFEKNWKELNFFVRPSTAELEGMVRRNIGGAIAGTTAPPELKQALKDEYERLFAEGLKLNPTSIADAYQHVLNNFGGAGIPRELSALGRELDKTTLSAAEKDAIEQALGRSLRETKDILEKTPAGVVTKNAADIEQTAKEYADFLSGEGAFASEEQKKFAALLRKDVSKAQLRNFEEQESMLFVVDMFSRNRDIDKFLKQAESFGKLPPKAQKELFKSADRFFAQMDPKMVDLMLGKLETGAGAAKFAEFVGKSLNSVCNMKTVIPSILLTPVLLKLGVSPATVAGGWTALCGARAAAFTRDHKLIAIFVLSWIAHYIDMQNQKQMPHGENAMILHESIGGLIDFDLGKGAPMLQLIKDYDGSDVLSADVQRFHAVSPCKADMLVKGRVAAVCRIQKGSLDSLSLFAFSEGTVPSRVSSIEFSEAFEKETKQASGEMSALKRAMLDALRQSSTPQIAGTFFKENEWLVGKDIGLKDQYEKNYLKVLGTNLYMMDPNGKLFRLEEKLGWYPITWGVVQYDAIMPAAAREGLGVWQDFRKIGGRPGWEYAVTKDLQLFARSKGAKEYQRYDRGDFALVRKTPDQMDPLYRALYGVPVEFWTVQDVDAALKQSEGQPPSLWQITENIGIDYYTQKFKDARGFAGVNSQSSQLKLRTANAEYIVTPSTDYAGQTIKDILDERIKKYRNQLASVQTKTSECLAQGTKNACDIALLTHQAVMFQILAEDFIPSYSRDMLDLLAEVENNALELIDRADPQAVTKLKDIASGCVLDIRSRDAGKMQMSCGQFKDAFDKFIFKWRFAEVLPEEDKLAALPYREAEIRVRFKDAIGFEKELQLRAQRGKIDMLLRPAGAEREDVLRAILEDLDNFIKPFEKHLVQLKAQSTLTTIKQVRTQAEADLRGVLNAPQQTADQLRAELTRAQLALRAIEVEVMSTLAGEYGLHKHYTNLEQRTLTTGPDGKLRYFDESYDPHTFVFLSMQGQKDLPFRREPPRGQFGPDAKYHHLAGELAEMANLLQAVDEYFQDSDRAKEARSKITQYFADADTKSRVCMAVACSALDGSRCDVPAQELADSAPYLPCYEALMAYKDASSYFVQSRGYFSVLSQDEIAGYGKHAAEGVMGILSSANTLTKLFKIIQRFKDNDPGAVCVDNNGWRAPEYRAGVIPGTTGPYCYVQSYEAVNRAWDNRGVFGHPFDNLGTGYEMSLFYSPFFSSLYRVAPHPAAEAGLRGIRNFFETLTFGDIDYKLTQDRTIDSLGRPRDGIAHVWTPYEVYAYMDLRDNVCRHAAEITSQIPALDSFYRTETSALSNYVGTLAGTTDTSEFLSELGKGAAYIGGYTSPVTALAPGILVQPPATSSTAPLSVAPVTATAYYQNCMLEMGSVYPEFLESLQIYDGFAYRPEATRLLDFDSDVIPVMREIERDSNLDDDSFVELLAKKVYFGRKERNLQEADSKQFLNGLRDWYAKYYRSYGLSLDLSVVQQLRDDEFNKWVKANNVIINTYGASFSGEKAVKECAQLANAKKPFWGNIVTVTPKTVEIDPNMYPYKDWNNKQNYCYSAPQTWIEKFGEGGLILVSAIADPILATIGGAVCAPLGGAIGAFACSRITMGVSGAVQAMAAQWFAQVRAWPNRGTLIKKFGEYIANKVWK